MLLKDEAGRAGCGPESPKREIGRCTIYLGLITAQLSISNSLSITSSRDLVGGCDIVTEMADSGGLQTLITETTAAQPMPAE